MGQSTPELGRVQQVAQNIRRLADQASITRNKLATTAGVPRQSLYRKLATTPEEFNLRELDNIADVLGVTILDLLDGWA